MDLDMPGGDGLGSGRLAEAKPDARVLVVTMYEEQEKLLPVLHAGARLPLEGGRRTRAGRRDPCRRVRRRVRAAGRRARSPTPCTRRRASGADGARLERLSHREQDVVALTQRGSTGRRSGGSSASPPRRWTRTSSARGEAGLRASLRVRALRAGPDCSTSWSSWRGRQHICRWDAHRPPLPDSGRWG